MSIKKLTEFNVKLRLYLDIKRTNNIEDYSIALYKTISLTVADIYAPLEAPRDMNRRLWVAGEMGIHIEWPGRIFVDNAAERLSGGFVSEWNEP